MKPQSALHLVTPAAAPVEEPEEVLAELVPQLARAEAEAASIRSRIDEQRRRLAVKRGVAFIRFEHVRREFEEQG